MASTPGRHDEVHNFVRKFLSLHGAGRKARLNLDCHGGQLWVSLHAELGEQPGQAAPLLPQHGVVLATHQTKPPPRRRRPRKGGRSCREAHRARRVLATFLALPFYRYEADKTLVDPTPSPSTETVESEPSPSAAVVDMDTSFPSTPPPATSHTALALVETMRGYDDLGSDVYSLDSDVCSPRNETFSSDEKASIGVEEDSANAESTALQAFKAMLGEHAENIKAANAEIVATGETISAQAGEMADRLLQLSSK